jgi:hypothetical protein
VELLIAYHIPGTAAANSIDELAFSDQLCNDVQSLVGLLVRL